MVVYTAYDSKGERNGTLPVKLVDIHEERTYDHADALDTLSAAGFPKTPRTEKSYKAEGRAFESMHV